MEPAKATREGLFNHEIGHVFGLLHEHQRPDRDTYIRVPATGDAIIPMDVVYILSLVEFVYDQRPLGYLWHPI